MTGSERVRPFCFVTAALLGICVRDVGDDELPTALLRLQAAGGEEPQPVLQHGPAKRVLVRRHGLVEFRVDRERVAVTLRD